MAARRLAQLALTTVALVSGTYVFVYLVRWEWSRATISALLFLATEVLLVGSLLASRLARIEARLDQAADPRVLQRLSAAQPPPRVTFSWLSPSSGSTNVLVPVLMGAGVVISLVAFAVERVARVTAGPVAERGLARRLSALSLPQGGLLPTPGSPAPAPAPPVRHGARAALLGLLLVALLGGSVVVLAERLQTRPDPVVPAVTVLQMTVDGRRTARSTDEIAEALWVSCRGVVPRDTAALIEVTAPATGEVRLTLTPGLGTYSSRRLRGCLGDLGIERFQARDVREVGSAAGGG